jgi:GrpB-like predicted nucleotidyltransferase (UPF0157 family)
MTTPEEPVSRRRSDVVTSELIGGVERRDLIIAPYDPGWPMEYRAHQQRIRDALGPAALGIEHIGSTSVPGLGAKPIIDVLLAVRDITAEEDYLPHLTAVGYELRVREPGHRMVRTRHRDVHVHIYEPQHPACSGYLLLRDRLRENQADRELYERTKRALCAEDWPDMNAYAEAKTEVIEAIKARARAQA